MKTEFTSQTKLTFDQMPSAIALLVEEVANLKELIRLQAFAEPVGERKPIGVREASKLIQKSIQTIYGLTSTNSIPFRKVGKQLYFYTDELLDWIENNGEFNVENKS